jgi:hypothetical protein
MELRTAGSMKKSLAGGPRTKWWPGKTLRLWNICERTNKESRWRVLRCSQFQLPQLISLGENGTTDYSKFSYSETQSQLPTCRLAYWPSCCERRRFGEGVEAERKKPAEFQCWIIWVISAICPETVGWRRSRILHGTQCHPSLRLRPFESYEEQRMALSLGVNAVNMWLKQFAMVIHKGFLIIARARGRKETFVLQAAGLYAMTRGLRVMSTTPPWQWAIAIGGYHLHRLFQWRWERMPTYSD